MNIKKTFFLSLAAAILAASPATAQRSSEADLTRTYAPDGVPFCVADSVWRIDSAGNHRAVIRVERVVNRTARVKLRWRRPDRNPEAKEVRIVNALTGDTVRNLKRLTFTADEADIIFEADSAPATYYVYYLPFKYRYSWAESRGYTPMTDYIATQLRRHPYVAFWWSQVPFDVDRIPVAKVLRYEARTAFDFFTPMGTIATQHETDSLRAAHQENPVLVQEARTYAIRLTDRLPWRWVERGLPADFTDEACRGEYFVWQVGVWAAHEAVSHVSLSFSDLTHKATGHKISRDSLTCFNLTGIDTDGRPTALRVDVPQGGVQALWCGVQVPADAEPGLYEGTVIFSADGVSPRPLRVAIKVNPQLLADHGDGDLWRLARLRWLNSTIGIDNHPTKDFQAMSVAGRTIRATEKTLTLTTGGMPESIEVSGRRVLARPMTFVVVTDKGRTTFRATNVDIRQEADGLVGWTATSVQDGLHFHCKATMEFDGFVDYKVTVTADQPVQVKDVQLVADYTPHASTYLTWGDYAGDRPEQATQEWTRAFDSYWMGAVDAGMRVEYRGEGVYYGPMLLDYRDAPPPNWYNGGRGRLTVSGRKGASAHMLTSTGETTIDAAGKTYEFALSITPCRPLDTRKQFTELYYHGDPFQADKAGAHGANVINVHQGTTMHPYINYPFYVRTPLVEYIDRQHQQGRKVKLYYTAREMSNFCTELYALKSLGHEVVAAGAGYGMPWLQEHLIDDYSPAWYTPLADHVQDASIVFNTDGRWVNYYLEGYRWMAENYHVDGVYIDEVAFDRDVAKRLRKVLDTYSPGALIDLHSCRTLSIGPAYQYTGLFPYIDRLWIGEDFDYTRMSADEWLVEVSGLPFGLTCDMLHLGGNPWLGMVFGSYSRAYPLPMWNIWKDFGIADAHMLGYWDKACPVSTGSTDVVATAYVRGDRTLVAVGNFSHQDHTVKLSIDWKKLGYNPKKATITIPAIGPCQDATATATNTSWGDLQQATPYRDGQPLTVKGQHGYFIFIEN